MGERPTWKLTLTLRSKTQETQEVSNLTITLLTFIEKVNKELEVFQKKLDDKHFTFVIKRFLSHWIKNLWAHIHNITKHLDTGLFLRKETSIKEL
jgi:hypothetical protein